MIRVSWIKESIQHITCCLLRRWARLPKVLNQGGDRIPWDMKHWMDITIEVTPLVYWDTHLCDYHRQGWELHRLQQYLVSHFLTPKCDQYVTHLLPMLLFSQEIRD
jgi:hypothetical protein